MTSMTQVGIDLAKRVFHVTAADDTGEMLERKKPRRAGLAADGRNGYRGYGPDAGRVAASGAPAI